MRFRFVVEIEVERVKGKFATRDEIRDQIQEALESADPGTYEGDNGGQYETQSWEVNEEEEIKIKTAKTVTAATVAPLPPLIVPTNISAENLLSAISVRLMVAYETFLSLSLASGCDVRTLVNLARPHMEVRFEDLDVLGEATSQS